MDVFLVGEGRHDIGDLAVERPYRGRRPGFMQPVVERLVEVDVSFDGQKVSLFGRARVRGLKDALARKAYIAATLARATGSDVLIFITDLDKGSGTGQRQAREEIERRSKEIRKGSAEGSGGAVVCVPGIPCRTIEAWALSDRRAIERINSGGPARLPDGKRPEELWGERHDPNSNHPKMVLARILGREATQDDLSKIAEDADIESMREVCSLSFEPFASELENAVAEKE